VFRVPPEDRPAYEKAETESDRQKLRTFYVSELPDPSGRSTLKGFGISVMDPTKSAEDNLFRYRTDGKAVTEPIAFRFGLSPYYFAFVEYRRVNEIIRRTHVVPTLTGMRVVDAWPAMSLRLWCRDDLYYSQKTMLDLFGPDGEAERIDLRDQRAVNVYLNKLSDIQDCYRNIQFIAPKSIDLFHEHIARYPMNKAIHDKHIFETQAYQANGKAEGQLFNALIAWQGGGRQLNPAVTAEFTRALPLYQDAIDATYAWVNYMYPQKEGQIVSQDRLDFERYAHALEGRKQGIERLLKTPPTEQPDMSFLIDETVER
jgi:hypothetical protein